jgi:hypothetical protein
MDPPFANSVESADPRGLPWFTPPSVNLLCDVESIHVYRSLILRLFRIDIAPTRIIVVVPHM